MGRNIPRPSSGTDIRAIKRNWVDEVRIKAEERLKTEEENRLERLEAEENSIANRAKKLADQTMGYQKTLKGEIGIAEYTEQRLQARYKGMSPEQLMVFIEKNVRKKYSGMNPTALVRMARAEFRKHAKYIHDNLAVVQERVVATMSDGYRKLAGINSMAMSSERQLQVVEKILAKEEHEEKDILRLNRHMVVGKKIDEKGGSIINADKEHIRKMIHHYRLIGPLKKEAEKLISEMKRARFDFPGLRRKLAKVRNIADEKLRFWYFASIYGMIPRKGIFKGVEWNTKFKDKELKIISRHARFPIVDFGLEKEEMKWVKKVDDIIRWTDYWSPELDNFLAIVQGSQRNP